jgi:hypothetical protein
MAKMPDFGACADLTVVVDVGGGVCGKRHFWILDFGFTIYECGALPIDYQLLSDIQSVGSCHPDHREGSSILIVTICTKVLLNDIWSATY